MYKERFWSKVNIKGPEDCWEWTACIARTGYGNISITRNGKPKRSFLSHRIAYELGNGPIPDGMHIMHKCDNRACCNPSHLVPGNNLANINDSVRKGRRKGITRNRPSGLIYKTGSHYKSKWRPERDRMVDLRRCGHTLKEIAGWFSCNIMTVHRQLKLHDKHGPSCGDVS